MGWLSDLFSGGSSSSSSSSSSNNDKPTPTVVKTGTTLKTGTVLNNDDDPVVFTPKDDGGYVGQNQSTLPAATTTDDDKSFGEVFSENRAAGEDTFVYKGEVYTTDLAPATTSVSYDAFGNAYDTPAAAAQADQVAEAQAAAAQNAITAASNAALDPRGDQIQSPTSNGAGIASLGEDDAGSALPDSSQVAGGGWEEYFQNASTQDILDLAGSNVQLPVTPDATFSYDAFGNEYSTAAAAAAADLAAEAAASNYGTMSQQDFVDQYATDDAAGISDALKYAAIVGPENVGNMFSGLGRQTQITSPLNMIPTTGREVGINALIPYLTNQFGTLLMSEEDKRNRMLAADPNRPGSLTSKAMQDFGGYLSGTVSPYIRDYLQPESGQAVFEGDIGGPLTVTDLSGNQLTGPQATQGIVNTTAGEVSDTGLDVLLGANPVTRTISAALNAGEQLTGLEQGISSNIDEAYVSGALDGNETFQEALKAQGGDVDKALGVIKDLAYVSGDIPANLQVASSGMVDAVLPKVGKGILGFGKEIAKRGAVEGGQGAFESYTAINAINQALGTDFDPTKNIVGAAATEGVAGTGAATVGSAAAQGLSARQRRNALDEAAVMSQPVVGPYGGMDTSGITAGFKSPRQPSDPGAPQTIEGQYSVMADPTVYDPSKSPTAGQLAGPGGVETAYERVTEAAAAPEVQDSFATSLDAVAASEIIRNQIETTGSLPIEVAQNISKATGLSMTDIEAIAQDAVPGATIDPLLSDEVRTAPGRPGTRTSFGGSEIDVVTNSDGTTTLTNKTTGDPSHVATVEPGQDLTAAIQVFDEVTSGVPTGSAEPDPRAITVDSTGIASVKPDTAILRTGDDGKLYDRGELFTGQSGEDTYVAGEKVVEPGTDLTVPRASDVGTVPGGTDVTVANTLDLDQAMDADGTTEVVLDGTTDLSTAAALDGTTDVTVAQDIDDAIDSTATEISGSLTDQTTDSKTTVVPAVDSDISMLTEIEPPDEEVEVEVEDEVQEPGGDVTVDLDEDDTFVPVVTTTDENGDTITECPEGYIMVEGPDGPMCQKSVTTTVRRQRAGAGTRAYTGLSGNRGRVSPGQRSKENITTTTETVSPTTRSA